MATTEVGRSTEDEWIAQIEKIVGGVMGGDRAALREVVQGIFQHGLNFNAWEPVEDQEQATKTRGSALYQWWMQTAHDEIAPMVEKMTEYGGSGRALDLEEIGRGLVQSGVRLPVWWGDAHVEDASKYQELGCYFYLLGKFGRWTAAVAEGRPVSDDTLHDIGIYVRMVQRIRAVGGWPV